MAFCRYLFVTVLVSISSTVFTQSHRVVRVTDPAVSNANEVSIAINPTDPRNLIVVSRARSSANGGRSTSFDYVSEDEGLTWRTRRVINPSRRTQGDDSVAFSADGVVHHAFIAFRGLRDVRPEAPANGIFVTSSSDRGASWTDSVAVVDHRNTVMPFEDKPYVVVDRIKNSRHQGNVYIAWTRFDVYGSHDPGDQSHIFFSHSSDAGQTFTAPVRVSDVPGDAVDSDGTVEGAMPAVGVNGDVYVVWAGPSGLVFDRSRDGGWTFGDDKVLMATPGGWDIDIAGLSRHNGMPVTRVDHSGGPNHGSVYVNWIDERHGDPDVFIMASRDAGETWTGAVRVNTDAVGNKVEQMFTWLAIDPVDGSVNVVFYDRDGLKGTMTRVLLARSVDGGRTFVNHAIALPAFSCNEEVFFGDYSGIDAFGGLVAPVFMHFVDPIETAVSVAIFKFEPNTQIPLTP
jgi:hypothetical protein